MENSSVKILITTVLMVILLLGNACAEEFREVMKLDSGLPGLAWVVQVSDLHVSAFHPERAEALRMLLGRVLNMIKPSLVLITGDLTDAKNKERSSTRQDEAEWIEYNSSMQAVVKESGLPMQAFWDIRGNHDKYGVPYPNSPLDYFSRYSFSAHLNRNRPVHGVTLLGEDGWRHLFVGLDHALSIGVRGPSNLFGHPDDESLVELDSVLGAWDSTSSERVTKHVFGHFPMSFTVSTETGKRQEVILAKHGISGYVCGHLHAKFGRRLYKHHHVVLAESNDSLQGPGKADFWEWELGDWRMSRYLRIIAIHEGSTSFSDFRLYGGRDFSELGNVKLPTIIVPTFPLDSRFMLRSCSKNVVSGRRFIQALVFSPEPEMSVSVKIFDTEAASEITVYNQSMRMVAESSGIRAPLFQAPWEPEKYSDTSPTRYWVQITATSSAGDVLSIETRPFSVDNRDAGYRHTWMEYLVIGFAWEDFTKSLLYINLLTIIFGVLIVPKVVCVWSKRSGTYKKLVPNSRTDSFLKVAAKLPLWLLMEGVQNPALWWAESFFLVYLLLCPWFWGLPLADGHPMGYMTLRGWTVQLSWSGPQRSNIAMPDNMNIVLPFLYTIVLPLFFLGAALSAERAACEAQSKSAEEEHHNEIQSMPYSEPKVIGRGRTMKVKVVGGPKSSASEWDMDNALLKSKNEDRRRAGNLAEKKHRRTTSRLSRKIILFGCLLVGYVHLRFCSYLVSSYGAMAALASPGLAWSVPTLMIIAICETSALRT